MNGPQIGRKRTVLMAAAASSLGWAVLASSHSLWQLVLGRVLTGLCDCLATCGGYMYIAEVQLLTKPTKLTVELN